MSETGLPRCAEIVAVGTRTNFPSAPINVTAAASACLMTP